MCNQQQLKWETEVEVEPFICDLKGSETPFDMSDQGIIVTLYLCYWKNEQA